MDFPAFQPSPWHLLFTSPLLFPHQFNPENYVHWTQTPQSHIFSADLPGVKKEDIRVEIEDSIYLIIRTEAAAESREPRRSFMRKFRLPSMVDTNGISAGYEDGVLIVTVPRSFVRRGFHIDPTDLPARLELLARAA